MKQLFLLIAMVGFVMATFAQNSKTTTTAAPGHEGHGHDGHDHPTVAQNATMEDISYNLGILMGANLEKQGFDPKQMDFDQLAKGLKDGAMNPAVDTEQAMAVINAFMTKKQQEAHKVNIEEGEKFLATNAARKGVTTLPSGLQYEVMAQGAGAIPKSTDKVTVHYTGTLLNGEVFDSSVKRGEPATFPVTGVIKGWVEALQLMNVGSKWKLFIPSDLAYGERGAGGQIGPFATLVFEVELLGIN